MKIQAPARNPMAIPSPWGEMANRPPMWNRSRTFQLRTASVMAWWAGDMRSLYLGAGRSSRSRLAPSRPARRRRGEGGGILLRDPEVHGHHGQDEEEIERAHHQPGADRLRGVDALGVGLRIHPHGIAPAPHPDVEHGEPEYPGG